MSEASTTTPATPSAPDALPESAEVSATVAPIATEPDVAELAAAPTATNSPSTEPTTPADAPQTNAPTAHPVSVHEGEHKVLHIQPHIHVRWHADVCADGQSVYQGFIKDISLRGTSVYLERNLQEFTRVNLRIYVPPLHPHSEPHVIEVFGKIIYTAHDAAEHFFHTSIKFLEFKQAADQEYLESCIVAHARPR